MQLENKIRQINLKTGIFNLQKHKNFLPEVVEKLEDIEKYLSIMKSILSKKETADSDMLYHLDLEFSYRYDMIFHDQSSLFQNNNLGHDKSYSIGIEPYEIIKIQYDFFDFPYTEDYSIFTADFIEKKLAQAEVSLKEYKIILDKVNFQIEHITNDLAEFDQKSDNPDCLGLILSQKSEKFLPAEKDLSQTEDNKADFLKKINDAEEMIQKLDKMGASFENIGNQIKESFIEFAEFAASGYLSNSDREIFSQALQDKIQKAESELAKNEQDDSFQAHYGWGKITINSVTDAYKQLSNVNISTISQASEGVETIKNVLMQNSINLNYVDAQKSALGSYINNQECHLFIKNFTDSYNSYYDVVDGNNLKNLPENKFDYGKYCDTETAFEILTKQYQLGSIASKEIIDNSSRQLANMKYNILGEILPKLSFKYDILDISSQENAQIAKQTSLTSLENLWKLKDSLDICKVNIEGLVNPETQAQLQGVWDNFHSLDQ